MEESKGGGEVCDNNNQVQCIHHPHRTNPSGICAFCLQEKLGKLLSSSLPLPPPSSPSPPSLTPPSTTSSSLPLKTNDHNNSRLPFLLPKNKNKNPSTSSQNDIVFKRSKSTATPTRNHFHRDHGKRNGFWSFLYLPSSSKSSASCSKKLEAKSFGPCISTVKPREKFLASSSLKRCKMVVEEVDDSVSASSKVSRSRSVGCGSRSFSGDFFERISSGLGDCTLRRVESQREGKPKVPALNHCMKERVKCGGIFAGFMLNSSSSSSTTTSTTCNSSSSSSYWVSSAVDDVGNGVGVALSNGRSSGRAWAWAFASPMRAFTSKTTSKDSKRGVNGIRNEASDKRPTSNLSDIPSLLTVTV